jgi:hypothetical protein
MRLLITHSVAKTYLSKKQNTSIGEVLGFRQSSKILESCNTGQSCIFCKSKIVDLAKNNQALSDVSFISKIELEADAESLLLITIPASEFESWLRVEEVLEIIGASRVIKENSLISLEDITDLGTSIGRHDWYASSLVIDSISFKNLQRDLNAWFLNHAFAKQYAIEFFAFSISTTEPSKKLRKLGLIKGSYYCNTCLSPKVAQEITEPRYLDKLSLEEFFEASFEDLLNYAQSYPEIKNILLLLCTLFLGRLKPKTLLSSLTIKQKYLFRLALLSLNVPYFAELELINIELFNSEELKILKNTLESYFKIVSGTEPSNHKSLDISPVENSLPKTKPFIVQFVDTKSFPDLETIKNTIPYSYCNIHEHVAKANNQTLGEFFNFEEDVASYYSETVEAKRLGLQYKDFLLSEIRKKYLLDNQEELISALSTMPQARTQGMGVLFKEVCSFDFLNLLSYSFIKKSYRSLQFLCSNGFENTSLDSFVSNLPKHTAINAVLFKQITLSKNPTEFVLIDQPFLGLNYIERQNCYAFLQSMKACKDDFFKSTTILIDNNEADYCDYLVHFSSLKI